MPDEAWVPDSKEGRMSQSAGWYAILLPCAQLDYCFLDPFLSLAIVHFESHGAF